jgi:ATP-dependent DNA helicase RecG
MNKKTILDYIKKGESETVEFKSAFDQAVRSYGLKDPSFEEIQDGFLVTFFKTPQKTTQKATQKATQKITQKISAKDRILEILRENPNLTRSEMAQLLGKSQNTIKDHLAALKSENRVERIGSDRDGYWRVK